MKITTGLLAFTLAAGIATAQDNYATWGSMRVLTLNAGGLTTGLGKFPVLVRLTSAQADVFTNSKGRGADLRFTRADLATRYKHQIERWDSAGQKAEIWVLLDTVRAGANATIKMLWNKAGAADSSSGRAVFDTANGFVSVLHLGDSTGTNPRPNQVAGAPTGILRNFDSPQDFGARTYAPTAGVIGFSDSLRGGQDTAEGDRSFPGIRDYIDLNHRGYNGFTDFTTGFFFSVWINVTTSMQYERFLEMSDDTASTGGSASRIILFGNHTTAPQNLSVRWGGGITFNDPVGSRYVAGEWHHVAFSKPEGNSEMTVYADGVSIGNTAAGDPPSTSLRDYATMGRSTVTAGDQYYSGKFDESVIARRARSADWVRLSYATQKPAATAVTFAATTAPAAGGTDFTGIAGGPGRSPQGFSARAAGAGMRFRLPAAATAGRVSIVDVWGRTVWSRKIEAGTSEIVWDGRASKGQLTRGVYVARFSTGFAPALEQKFTYNP